jgi:hypothetical protein
MVRDGDRTIASSERNDVNAPLGAVSEVGDIELDGTTVRDARKLELVATL